MANQEIAIGGGDVIPPSPPWATATRKSRAVAEIGDTSHLRCEVEPGGWLITIPGVLPGKPRHRHGNGKSYRTDKQAKAEALVKRCALEQNAGREIIDGAARVTIASVWPVRDGGLHGEPMAGKPDLDNVAKLVLDALNKVVWTDDCRIAELRVAKLYGCEPRVVIFAEPCKVVPFWARVLIDGEAVH